VDLPGIEDMAPLIQSGIVSVVRHPNEVNLLQINLYQPIEKIFNPDWKNLYGIALKQL
jgi:hypothetical protein